VLTNALLGRVGLSAILQAIYKEGLRVVQARSNLLHINVARKLLDLAGQSSLSMKPSLNVLMSGPVLYLAIEGNAHVILRLKSILQQPVTPGGGSIHSLHMNVYNPRALEDAKNGAVVGVSSHYSLGQLGA
jgi:nucleoside diphosphate kinase